jgi:hypothetical protein
MDVEVIKKNAMPVMTQMSEKIPKRILLAKMTTKGKKVPMVPHPTKSSESVESVPQKSSEAELLVTDIDTPTNSNLESSAEEKVYLKKVCFLEQQEDQDSDVTNVDDVSVGSFGETPKV